MNKKGFTLIELLAVIVIIGLISTLMITKVEKNIKDAKNLASENQISMIESAAMIYQMNYSNELTTLNSINVQRVALSVLVNKGLIKASDIEGIPQTNTVMLAKINNNVKAKYDPVNANVIFLNGLDTVTIKTGSIYTDMGASVAIPGTGIIELNNSDMIIDVNEDLVGTYTVIYVYVGAADKVRTVKVID